MSFTSFHTLPTEQRGWIYIFTLYSLCFLLHKALPPYTTTTGYVCDCRTKLPLEYRYNGFYTLLTVLFGLYYLSTRGLFDPHDYYQCYWPMCRAAFTLGLSVSLYLYFRGTALVRQGLVDRGSSCLTVNSPRSRAAKATQEFDKRSTLEHFYCGIEWNPKIFNVDIKMFNYLVGAVALACNVLAAAATHAANRPTGMSNAMWAYLIPMGWFLCEYMWFENVHVYTYDIFRERTGLKMVWGCFFFYPFFYCIGVWSIVQHFTVPNAADVSPAVATGCVVLFFMGWALTRGANLQKFGWRHNKAPMFLGRANETVVGSKGRLLVSGFWGLARHINYTGEIIQGLSLALPGYLVSGSFLPFLYPVYYVLLFVGRDQDDDKSCQEKYGKAWDKYVAMVPYRMVPGIY